MAAALQFEWDSRALKMWRGKAVDGALTRAVRLAGNRAARTMQDESVKHVLSRKFLREKDGDRDMRKDELPLDMPGRKAVLRALVWTERVSGDPVPLSRFPYIQTKTGVSVRVNRGGGTKRLKSAFVRRMSSGHIGVFRRKGKERLPIQELWTSRISDVMNDEGAIPRIQDEAGKKLGSVFAKGLDRELEKLKRKGLA